MDINDIPQELKDESKAATLKGINLFLKKWLKSKKGDQSYLVITQGEELPKLNLVARSGDKEIASDMVSWVETVKECNLKGSTTLIRNGIKLAMLTKPGFENSINEGVIKGGVMANNALSNLLKTTIQDQKELVFGVAVVAIPCEVLDPEGDFIKSVNFYKFTTDSETGKILHNIGIIDFMPF